MNDPTSLTTIILAAATLRGAIITSYAQIEHLLVDIIVRCQPMPEYAQLPQGFPYKLTTRIARVRKLVGMRGPLAKYQSDFENIVGELQQYEQLRHFMAHGLLVVRNSEDGSHSLTYRMYRETKGPTVEEGTIVSNLEELGNAAKQIALYAKGAVALFRDVYCAHNLEPR
jgi:hypothetical protein